MSGKPIFSLLFFEHRYLGNRELSLLDILEIRLKHSFLVKCVLEFFFRA